MNTAWRTTFPFILPWAIGLCLLILLPMIALFALSLTNSSGPASGSPFTWVGLEHYRALASIDNDHSPSPGDPWYWSALGGRPRDVKFYQSLYNSLCYSLLAVPLGLLSSLLVALLLNRAFRGASILRACVYLPHVLGGVATLILWSWLLNPQFGGINGLIRYLYDLADPVVRLFCENGSRHWPTPGWLYSPFWCKPAVILIHVWTMGGAMLIFLAALRRVPKTLHEAAALDGAGGWRRFRHITWPHITPVVLFNLIVSLIFTVQTFNEPYVLQNRAQDNGLLFYVLYIYQAAFEPPYRLGYAAALSCVLLVVLAVLILPLVWTSRRWVYYGDVGGAG